MKFLKLPLFALLSLMTLAINAQNFGDALRYSAFNPIGTARFMGAGSALSPLGADFSVMSTNPAGLAWMRKGEFMITPGIYSTSTESVLGNTNDKLVYDDASIQFTLPNIGLVTHSNGGSSIKAFNFGIGINRLADFNQQFFYKGKSKGSIMQRFEELSNDKGLDDFEAGVAYSADALWIPEGANGYVSDFSDQPDLETTKEESIIRTGSLSEFAFGFAVNHDNKLLWGLSVGVPLLRYEEEKRYTEKDEDNSVEAFENLSYTQNLLVNGSGINLKLGFIYRVHQALRLSAAIHTPTYYQIDEQFSSSMVYNYTLEGSKLRGEGSSPQGQFNYGLRTPWRLSVGAGTIFSKYGFLSAELEYVNYAKNRFLYDGFADDEAVVNQGVKDNLSNAVKLNIGGELAMGTFRVRGGFIIQQSPLVDDTTISSSFSFGIGLRQRSYFLDLGYRRGLSKETYTPYAVTNGTQQFIDNDVIKENIALTIGFKW